eukprot:363681-Chlamydomonas_euryale.AAC.5
MMIPWLQQCAQHAQSMHLGFSTEGVACWVWRPMKEWRVMWEPHSTRRERAQTLDISLRSEDLIALWRSHRALEMSPRSGDLYMSISCPGGLVMLCGSRHALQTAW